MYKVDPKTLLFVDLDKEHAIELLDYAKAIVTGGHTDLQHPAFCAWYEAHGLRPGQDLLVYATAFPQRALLSVANYLTSKG